MVIELLEVLKTAIVEGDDILAADKAREALTRGIDPRRMVSEAILAGIQRTGELWQANQYFLPDVILSAEAFKAAMNLVEPLLRSDRAGAPTRRFVIGTVKGDMHDLGKSLVSAMLEAEGFEVVDLGVDVPLATFVSKAREVNADVVGLGAYMTTTMQQMREIIRAFSEAGLRERVKIMIGGVPTSQEFADELGADAWGKDALDAAQKASALVRAAQSASSPLEVK